jgi:polyhydroxybutyrate depolymerase
LPFDHVPTRDELEQRIAAGKRPANYARILIDRLDRGEKLPASFSYPVQTWVFGSDLAMIFLSGEVLVDYSLRLKRELDGSRLWITAYANDTPGYIASRRVIAEGGYEVDDSMNNYDKPTRLALVAEDLIVNAAKQLTPLPFFESGGATFQRMEWKVGDVTREALVRFPPKAKTGTAPLLFVWHGYGGTMRAAVSFLPMFAHWPDAIVVHAQGLPVSRTVGGVEVTKPGWQLEPGEFADRDVKFFDAMLDTFLREHRVDAKRVFSTGHSNGGRFTQILWAERGDKHAAVAPSGTFVEAWLDRLTAKPCLHLAGEKDSKVPFARQLRMIDALLTINGCEASGEPWLPLNPGSTTRYPSSQGTPLVTIIHPGGHEFPSGAAELITTFFKQCLP